MEKRKSLFDSIVRLFLINLFLLFSNTEVHKRNDKLESKRDIRKFCGYVTNITLCRQR